MTSLSFQTRAHAEPCQTSRMKLFTEIVNYFRKNLERQGSNTPCKIVEKLQRPFLKHCKLTWTMLGPRSLTTDSKEIRSMEHEYKWFECDHMLLP